MTMILLAMALIGPPIAATIAPIQAKADYVETDDIVVTAVRNDCRVRLAQRTLSDSEFDRRIQQWARGRPVRVIARADADLKCLTKIAFKLADRGVTAIEFVDPSGRPAQPLVSPGAQRMMPANAAATMSGDVQPMMMSADPQAATRSAATPAPASIDVQDRERRFFAARAAKLILAGKCAEARRVALQGGDLDTAAKVAEICRAP